MCPGALTKKFQVFPIIPGRTSFATQRRKTKNDSPRSVTGGNGLME